MVSSSWQRKKNKLVLYVLFKHNESIKREVNTVIVSDIIKAQSHTTHHRVTVIQWHTQHILIPQRHIMTLPFWRINTNDMKVPLTDTQGASLLDAMGMMAAACQIDLLQGGNITVWLILLYRSPCGSAWLMFGAQVDCFYEKSCVVPRQKV